MISGFVFSVFVTSFCALILALQVRAGFPAFYFVREPRSFWFKPINFQENERRRIEDEDIEKTVKYLLLLMGLLIIGFGFIIARFQFVGSFLLLVSSGYIFWFVKRLRSEVRDKSGGVEFWLAFPITVQYPMLVFDVWVFGLAILVGAIGIF